jgi:hypothetical protein
MFAGVVNRLPGAQGLRSRKAAAILAPCPDIRHHIAFRHLHRSFVASVCLSQLDGERVRDVRKRTGYVGDVTR